jgi:hypothetical protein
MKLLITTTGAIADLQVQIENNYYNLQTILPLCKNVTYIATGVYVNIPMTITGVHDNGGKTATMQVIDDSDKNIYKNFTTANVNRFVRGKSYLVPINSSVYVPYIPSADSFPIAATNAVVTTSHFLHNATEDMDVLGGANPTCVQFDVIIENLVHNEKVKSFNTATRTQTFAKHC